MDLISQTENAKALLAKFKADMLCSWQGRASVTFIYLHNCRLGAKSLSNRAYTLPQAPTVLSSAGTRPIIYL